MLDCNAIYLGTFPKLFPRFPTTPSTVQKYQIYTAIEFLLFKKSFQFDDLMECMIKNRSGESRGD